MYMCLKFPPKNTGIIIPLFYIWTLHYTFNVKAHLSRGYSEACLVPTCVCPPALSSIFVVASVAELGKQVKKEDRVLEIPWANSSWN